jgi:4-hydroxy-tetrahydrodipicolinate synthase
MDFEPRGIIPALVTPLQADEPLDEGALRALIDHSIAGGAHGVFAIGSTDEANAFSYDGRCRITEAAIRATAGRVPIYIGTGANTTQETVDLSQAAGAEGASAVSVNTPIFVCLIQAKFLAHHPTVAAAVQIAVLLHNQSPRTSISPSHKRSASLRQWTTSWTSNTPVPA